MNKPAKPIDEAEEALYRRWKGRAADLRGESRCQYDEYAPLLARAPKEPWFGGDNPRTRQSMRAVKRWLSTNMKDWPTCRHHDEPAQLVFVARPHVGGDGEYCLP